MAAKTTEPKRLIVTADDFGIDIRVNEAIEAAFTGGILTCASLMMGGDAAHDAIERARRLKGLAIGLHVTLADGRPLLPRKRIPDLIGPDGRFRDGLFGVGVRWFFKPGVRRQLAAEIDAQFQAFVRSGLVLDHVNAHKHLHLHPTVSAILIRIGRRYGAPGIRIPAEPRRIIQRAEPDKKAPRSFLWPVLSVLRQRARAVDLRTNDRIFGLAWSGAMTEERLLKLIPLLPPGTSELYTHPAVEEAALMPHAEAGYLYREELAALTSPAVRAALAANGIALTRFSALGSARLHVAGERQATPA